MFLVPLPDKRSEIAEAIAQIADGASVMLGGFGVPGTPFCLIRELVRQGPRNLTVIKNDANEAGMGVDWLLESGQVAKLIASHIGLNPTAMRLMNEGTIEVEFVPQGILAERIRVAGAGMMGFISDIGIGTAIAEGKQRVEIAGKTGIVEHALTADFALIHANKADAFGNLTFSAAARNFNPLMAMAAGRTVIEAEAIVPIGALEPENVHLSGAFVDAVIELSELPEVYGVVKR
ncbi:MULTISPECIES: CoA transferase subunit A [Rhizobium]|uniref:CoA transferase subunit A n=1 Tax=Rhizobium TaxID=379 RepID=UPI001C837DDC|nr:MULTISPECIES: CoA transferase subunit A [Rhizobium]MBX4921886.1 CoA transferase subunit A [Rhizobium bangladeshense]MBY3447090.1 CoA transferase subunit A [Rhizobium laguerreae]